MIRWGSSFSSHAIAARSWEAVSLCGCFELLVLEAYVTAKPLLATGCSVALANLDSSRGYDARSFSAILSVALGYFFLSSLIDENVLGAEEHGGRPSCRAERANSRSSVSCLVPLVRAHLHVSYLCLSFTTLWGCGWRG